MIYGYARVSSFEQEMKSNILELQVRALQQAGVTEIFVDECTVVKSHRPRFEDVMNILQKGDILVITKLDRVANSVSQGADIISFLIERGVTVHVLDMGIFDNTHRTAQARAVLFAMAAFEKDVIVERAKEGKYLAKKNGEFKEGRPKVYSADEIENALNLLERNSYKQVEVMTGISKSTLIRAKRQKELEKSVK